MFFLRALSENELYEDYSDQIDDVIEAFDDLMFLNLNSNYGIYIGRLNGLTLWTGFGYSHEYPASETHFNNWRNLLNY